MKNQINYLELNMPEDSREVLQALRDSNARLKLLSDTASQLLVSDNPQELVQSLCEAVMEHLDCHAFFNYLSDDEHGCLHLNACAGIPEDVAKSIEWLDFGAAVCGCVARDGCRVIAEDIFHNYDPRTDLVKGYGIQAYACHPLLGQGGKVIGTLSFGSQTKTRFADDEINLMKTVADQVAAAMEKIRLLDSERKHAEALRESEARFRMMADSIPQLAWMADPDGYIFWYNQRWYEYTGTTPDQMRGWGWQSVHDPEMLPSVLERWKKSIETGEPFDMEFPLRGVDGRFRWFLTRVVPMKNSENRVERWFGTNTDISEKRDLEAHKREFYRRTIFAATDGKLIIAEPGEIESVMTGSEICSWDIDCMSHLAEIKKDIVQLLLDAEIKESESYAFIACIVEAVGNAVKHAGGGHVLLCGDNNNFMLSVLDSGPGIGTFELPEVALTRGYSTAGTLGMGYKLMLNMADKVYLATGPDGTKVAIQKAF